MSRGLLASPDSCHSYVDTARRCWTLHPLLSWKLCEGRVISDLCCPIERCRRDSQPERKGDVVVGAQALKPAWVHILPLFLTSWVTIAGDLTSLGLNFLIYKMRTVTPTSQAVVGIKEVNAWKQCWILILKLKDAYSLEEKLWPT